MNRFSKLILPAVLALAVAGTGHASPVNPLQTPWVGTQASVQLDAGDQSLRNRLSPTKLWNAACCKVCRKGKACGNSCIKKSYNCSKGNGCACDG